MAIAIETSIVSEVEVMALCERLKQYYEISFSYELATIEAIVPPSYWVLSAMGNVQQYEEVRAFINGWEARGLNQRN